MTDTTTVIYNGNCPICSREIAAYERYSEARDLPLAFTPLAQADLARLGLTPEDAARRIHVLHDGRLVAGVEAFAILWEAMPRFRWLGRVVRWPVVRPVAGLVYDRVLAPILYAMHRRRVARAAQRSSA